MIKESAETAEAIRKLLSYDAQTGIISWLAIGKGIAGLADERGYIKIYMLQKAVSGAPGCVATPLRRMAGIKH